MFWIPLMLLVWMRPMVLMLMMRVLTFMTMMMIMNNDYEIYYDTDDDDNDTDEGTDDDANDDTDDDTDDGGRGDRRPLQGGAVHFLSPPWSAPRPVPPRLARSPGGVGA